MIVSIVMPLFNSSKYMSESIDSIINQTYKDWELFLIDDCSTDSTFDVALSYATQYKNINVFKLNKNEGSAVARNLGIRKSRGRFIAFLDSDDLWEPNKLELQINYMINNNVYFCFSSYERINENGERIGFINAPKRVQYTDLLKVCTVGCLTAVYDTRKFGKIEMPLIRKRQDLGLWLKILKIDKYGYGIKASLAKYRVRADSISSNKKVAAYYTWKLYRDVEHLGYFRALYYFINYAINGVYRLYIRK